MLSEDSRGALAWAERNLREQLEAAYGTKLGALQTNNTLLLDEESQKLQQDCAAVWILTTVEILILELEALGEPQMLEPSGTPERTDVYYTSPTSLKRSYDIGEAF